jgi:predicted protein tyrosine phosphatase
MGYAIFIYKGKLSASDKIETQTYSFNLVCLLLLKVRGVTNLCEEYDGPVGTYTKLGIRHLHLPTTDHFEPSLSDMKRAIQFIAEHEQRKETVYVHCRAGHGRSAAIACAWLLTKNPNVNLRQLNEELCEMRNVRKTLYQQPNLLKLHSMLLKEQNGKGEWDDDGDDHNENDSVDNDSENDKVDESQLYRFNIDIEDEL